MSSKDDKKDKKDKDNKDKEKEAEPSRKQTLVPSKSSPTVAPTAIPTHTDAPNHLVLVNNSTYADVHFNVGKHKYVAHYAVIQIRCPGLLSPAGSKGQPKKNKNTYETDIPSSISPATFAELLQWVYSGSLQFEKLKESDVLQLAAATLHFEGLGRLQWMCENHIVKAVNMTNLYQVFKESDQLQLKYIKDYCIHFAIDHYFDFVNNKDAVKDLGIELFQETASAYLEHQAGRLKPVQALVEPADTFLADFKSLLDSGKNYDIEFQLADSKLMGFPQGMLFKGHKAIIAVRSQPLAELCAAPTTQAQKGLNAVPVKGVGSDAFQALLKWIYYGETNITTLAAAELVLVAKEYKLPELQKLCVDIMVKGVELDTALALLDLTYIKDMPDFYTEAMKELQPRVMGFVVDHFVKLDLKNIRERKVMHNNMACDILLALQTKAPAKAIPQPEPVQQPAPPAEPAQPTTVSENNNNNDHDEAKGESKPAELDTPKTKKKKDEEKKKKKSEKKDSPEEPPVPPIPQEEPKPPVPPIDS
mmetsp:Transcript_14041/g.19529  ORF Transcript_14041/g.19529 Transcript_14041/m.19529 type:complete len:532 (+) Transcript_14041:182-1777(+)|eukprot:CAMPEP_0168561898 /NCGR_PEP_ID=MMETSP0413-20121227/11839_1 /TAXON_ID=136452 /ORGANISM="Filamoeba nolandi, Strain NC-AS-23-1" /LENGTH=531 /DNA_ID=CAMNT_0008593297 /DNA_START=157 /DNA_END=1752 /DNA_ORIENTATION=+